MLPRRATRTVGVLTAFLVAAVSLPPAHGGARRLPRRISTHWAGYVDSAGATHFTAVQATWVQPHIRCDRPNSSAAFWIGLGGATATATGLEQIGTSADCSEDLLPSYSAWYELIPAPAAPVELPIRIAPGDAVTAEIATRDTTITLSMQNQTTGESFSTRTTSRHLDLSSAEWIAEAPSVCVARCATLPLADFGAVSFQRATAATNGRSGTIDDPAWTHHTIKLVAARQFVAVPSVLSTDGESFSVLWRDPNRPWGATPRS